MVHFPAEGGTSLMAIAEVMPDLDAERDINHVSYKVIGVLTWILLCQGAVGIWLWPQAVLLCARVLAFYLLVRFVLIGLFYVVAVQRCRDREASSRTQMDAELPPQLDRVHHVVIIPNYLEPVELLLNTLAALAAQKRAKQCVTVVVAMEAYEPGALRKAEQLQARYADRFAHFLITVHPSGLAGELTGKGSNVAWAAREAKSELVDCLGYCLDDIVVTVCDADSVLNRGYLLEVSRLFLGDTGRYRRFWCGPVLYRNNIRRVPAVVQLLCFQSEAARMGELASVLSWPLPVSTYSLSLALADSVGYWDPAVIAEDWHMFLRCFFATRGDLKLVPVYLPTSLDAVEGATVLETLGRYFRQQVRHSWGAEDVGYIIQQWGRTPEMSLRKKMLCLIWVLHHHTLRSTAHPLLVLGLLSAAVTGSSLIEVPGTGFLHLGYLWFTVLAAALAVVAIWVAGQTRTSGFWDGMSIRGAAGVLLAWTLTPLLVLVFATLPGLISQTLMLVGRPLVFHHTPKHRPSAGSGLA